MKFPNAVIVFPLINFADKFPQKENFYNIWKLGAISSQTYLQQNLPPKQMGPIGNQRGLNICLNTGLPLQGN